MNQYAKMLHDKGAFKVFLLKDLEQLSYKQANDQLKTQEELHEDIIVIFVKKMIEAWFLADTNTLSKVLKSPKLNPVSNPEKVDNPYKELKDKLKQVNKHYSKFGKPDIASLFLDHGFTFKNAAAHRQCKSAQKFHETLQSLGNSKKTQ